MDLKYPPGSEEFRTEIRGFLDEHLLDSWTGVGALDPDALNEFIPQWRSVLAENGLLAPHWPEKHGGRGLSVVEQSILIEEFVRRGAPHQPAANDPFGINLLGPTLLAWGTPEQHDYFLPRTLSGEIRWAQGYSEPEAGSDLFGLRTRAERTETGWRVNGQKIWQTAGVTANWIFMLVRTDPDLERGRGISFLLLPLDQEGVEVRGITNMAGQVEFSEVFFTDAIASHDHLVGPLNGGARVALTLLGFERGASGIAASLRNRLELDRIWSLATSQGRADDPRIRERLAECLADVHAQRSVAVKIMTMAANGEDPGALSSVVKLIASTYRQSATELALDLVGNAVNDLDGGEPQEMLQPQSLGFDADSSVAWLSDFLNARAISIYGGSSEIQRNTIAEQILGLPRDKRS
ncbi:MAG: acyl-CoA dehydrogenase [Comamonadaceae bacterium]|nr:MAG: acyl-CoA dehydrogenase [Comamonadaceae bacterium]